MDNARTVSFSSDHSGAIKTDGSLWTWGNNEYGQLGNGTTTNSSIPVKIMDNVKMVSLGGRHGAAVKADGSLWTWGNNEHGQLGNGTTTNSSIPVKIMDNVKRCLLEWDMVRQSRQMVACGHGDIMEMMVD